MKRDEEERFGTSFQKSRRLATKLQTTRLGHRRTSTSINRHSLFQPPNKHFKYRIPLPLPLSSPRFKISHFSSVFTHSMAPPKKHSKPATAKPASTPPQPPPNWPPLRPLVPPSDLSLATLLPSQIALIRNFWPSKLCKDYVSFLKTLPLVTTPGKPKKGDAVRVNDRFQVVDEGFARRLWEETGLEGLILGDGEEKGEGAEEEEKRMSESERRELWYAVPLRSLRSC
jgi:hypothetical protein